MLKESDEEIVGRVKGGEVQFFNELVIRYQARLYRLALRIIGNSQDASEVVQSAFFLAYKKISSFKARSSFFTWLYRIAINECYKKIRSIRHDRPTQMVSLDELLVTEDGTKARPIADETAHLPRDDASTKELQGTVRDALQRLPYKYYQVVLLKDIGGHSYEEIARILNCRKGTVMSMLFRARKRLSRYLKKFHRELLER